MKRLQPRRQMQLILAMLVILTVLAVNVHAAMASTPGVTTICKPLWHLPLDHGRYQYRNDTWLSHECLSHTSGSNNFRVSMSDASTSGPHVQAFPNIFTGCVWGICTRGSRLPARTYNVRPVVTWRSRNRAYGRWDASVETWFDPKPLTTGQATGAELMVWLDTHREPWAASPVVTVDGTQYYLRYWLTRPKAGKPWHLIIFRRVHPVQSVTNLRLTPFIKYAEHLRLINPNWYLENVMAGYEIWRNGTGLATRDFSVRFGRIISVPGFRKGEL